MQAVEELHRGEDSGATAFGKVRKCPRQLCLCCGPECLLLLPQAKLVGAQSRLRSVDVELLTKLCKELRQQFSDEVSYDGARLTPKTVRGASFAFPSDAVLVCRRGVYGQTGGQGDEARLGLVRRRHGAPGLRLKCTAFVPQLRTHYSHYSRTDTRTSLVHL